MVPVICLRGVVEPYAVLEIADGVLDLGVAAMVGLQVQVGDFATRKCVRQRRMSSLQRRNAFQGWGGYIQGKRGTSNLVICSLMVRLRSMHKVSCPEHRQANVASGAAVFAGYDASTRTDPKLPAVGGKN